MGLHDAHGNVREWCLDGYKRDFYLRSPRENPVVGLGADDRVVRGGGFRSSADDARSARRWQHQRTESSNDIGVRPCRTLDPP
jgi:formylglycine-generating enzyme required for sulfatase activity